MHPAPSIILFTVFSGLGFGLLAWLGIMPPKTGLLPDFYMFALGFAFAVGGLISSTLHLGNPQRAWRAFSQWRSSWLSREGCLAVAALGAVGILGAGRVFLGLDLLILGWIAALLCIATVYSTSMIYAQLKTVPAWNSSTVRTLFLAYAFTGGALLFGAAFFSIVGLIVLFTLQILYWREVDEQDKNRTSHIETATGLGETGSVRQLEPPHTGSNYLLQEMAFSIGRKHRDKLRLYSAILFAPAPFALIIFFWFLDLGAFGMILAAGLHILGTLGTRWLFFAEARHVVSLFYDKWR